MSSNQKSLKVISIVIIFFAVVTIVLAVSDIVVPDAASTATDSETAGSADLGVFTLALIALSFVQGVIGLITGILGVQGANDPNKIDPLYVVATIGAILAILGVLGSFAQTILGLDVTSHLNSLVWAVLMAVCLGYTKSVKKTRDGCK